MTVDRLSHLLFIPPPPVWLAIGACLPVTYVVILGCRLSGRISIVAPPVAVFARRAE